ncbi:MAG: phosphoribosylglycinamide formyltransferase [Nitrospirales bacterium]|nr:phosphoribosylglycinamide formyltransferase [Nitrospirales bacterium]
MTLALGVLASGRGSNFQAILDAIHKGTLDAVVKVVLSNKSSALALERGRTHRIPSIFLDPKPFAESQDPRDAYDRAVGQVLHEHGVEAVVLAGYMRIVTPALVRQFPWKIFNIHPSILPSFPGLHAQRQALEWGAKVSGCSVHFVTEGVDEGPVIIQMTVPVLEDDTEESLSARILEQEHVAFPKALQWFAQGRLAREGRRVTVLPSRDREGEAPERTNIL